MISFINKAVVLVVSVFTIISTIPVYSLHAMSEKGLEEELITVLSKEMYETNDFYETIDGIEYHILKENTNVYLLNGNEKIFIGSFEVEHKLNKEESLAALSKDILNSTRSLDWGGYYYTYYTIKPAYSAAITQTLIVMLILSALPGGPAIQPWIKTAVSVGFAMIQTHMSPKPQTLYIKRLQREWYGCPQLRQYISLSIYTDLQHINRISYKSLNHTVNFEGIRNLYTNPPECRRQGY